MLVKLKLLVGTISVSRESGGNANWQRPTLPTVPIYQNAVMPCAVDVS
jgi:hypothetical protein